jgi:hypothetical protein
MQILMQVDWLDEPVFEVEQHPDRISVVADARLSQQQVKRACEELGEHGDRVYEAWEAVLNASAS